MPTVKEIWEWLKPRWWIPLFFLAVAIGWILRPRKTPIAQTKVELAAIEEAGKVKKMEATLGAEIAKAQLRDKFTITIAQFNEQQAQQAKQLEDDPAELAKFLVRAASK